MGGTTTPTVTGDKVPDSAFPKSMRPKMLTLPMPTLANLRFTFFTEKGAAILTVPAEDFYPKEEIKRQWIRISIPLNDIDPSFAIGEKLTRIVISSDKPNAFLIGRMAFMLDEDPIVMHPLIYPAFIEAGKRIFFASRPESGLAKVETNWNFDHGNGQSIDAKGDRTTYTFDSAGLYTLTCTVRDVTGGKDPVKQVIEVRVGAARDTKK